MLDSLLLHPPLAASGGGRPIHGDPRCYAICEVFEVSMSKLVQGLDKEGVYESSMS